MGEGGEYGGETDERERRSYESGERDEEGHEREARDLLDELEREMDEDSKEADDLSKELEREMEDEARAGDIADELEREMENDASSKEMEEESSELDGFEKELNHELDETRDDLHDDYVNDMEKQLENASTKESTTDDESNENDTGTSSDMTESSESSGDAGGGMVYTMEPRGGSGEAEATETEEEPQEASEPGAQESTEQQTESESSEEPVNEKGTNRITRQESEEGETLTSSETNETHGNDPSSTSPEVSETDEDLQEVGEGRSDPGPEVSREDQHETSEFTATEEDEEQQTRGTITETSDLDTGPEDLEQDMEYAPESYEETESHEQNEAEEDSIEHETLEPEMDEDTEVETELLENKPSAEDESLPEDLEDFVKRVKDIMDEKMDADDDYDYVQDPLTGEMQRVTKILSEFETEEQKQRRKLLNLFAELSEEEREHFKSLVKAELENKEDYASQVEREWSKVVDTASEKFPRKVELDTLTGKIHRLYYEEGLTQQKVAEKLGFKTTKPIRRIFDEQGWDARWGSSQKGTAKPSDFQERRTRGRLDPEEVKRLYFDEGLTHKQIAERAGFSSVNPVRKIFKEQGWKSRIQRGGVSPQHFKSEEERRLARIEHKKKTAQRIRELREKMWGTECTLCGVSKERRLLHIHRKDGKQHPKEVLHRLKVLKSLESNDYVPLCGTCHSGTHWLMNNQGMTWKNIKSYSENFNKSLQTPKEPLALPDARVKSSERYLGLIKQKDISPKELRREIFGENCRFCGTHSDDMRIFVHRKDLRPHRKRLLESKKYLRTLNPDEWATLCPICHRRTHWAGETLGLDWDDLESAFKQRST